MTNPGELTPGAPFLVLAGTVLAGAALAAWLLDIGSRAFRRWRQRVTERSDLQARELFLQVDPQQLFLAQVVGMLLAGAVIGLLTGQVLSALAGVLVCAAVPRLVYLVARRRRWRRFDAQLPDALMLLAGALRAGVGLGSAVQQLVARTGGPLAQEFSVVLREQRLGVSLDDALAHLSRRVPTDAATLVVSALRIAGDTGGTLAETLERTAVTIRSRLQMEAKIDALTAQGRLQAWVVGALPLVLMGVLQRLEPQAMALMWSTPAGWAALGVVAFLLVLGIHLIRRVVAIDV